MTEVAVIGAGLIGQAWALVFARGGCPVRLWDGDAAALERAVGMVATLARELQASGLIGEDAAALVHRIRAVPELATALDGVEYVQENLPEQLPLKREIFARMDALAPAGAVLASSTSSIPASQFTEGLAGRVRCLVAHPVNPPYLVPVVELCGAPWTSPDAIERCRVLMQQVGQKPVHVKRELEGFVLNRLQGALLREAFRLVEQGVVDVDGLDTTIRDGLGLRWSFMGPFETIDLNAPAGLVDYCARYGELYRSIATEQVSTAPWSPELIARIERERREVVPAGQLRQRREWRDRRLMALAAHKRAAES
jgi:L-gulonate 3-dehydrogenase